MKNFDLRSFIRIQIIIFLGLAFLSTFLFKQIHMDGAFWAFDILNFQKLHIERQFFRYSTLLLQIPAYISSKLLHNSFATTWSFCLAYGLYPFIFLLFIYKKLTYEKKDLAILFFFIFLISIVPNWIFAVSVTNESICLAMLLYFSIVIYDRNFFLFSISSVGLLFSYESGFVFYFMAIYLLYREKKLNKWKLIFLCTLTILQLLNLFLYIIPNKDHQHFTGSFLRAFKNPLFYYGFICLITLILASLDQLKKKLPSPYLIISPAIGATILFLIYLPMKTAGRLVIHSYDNRIWAIPIALLGFITIYELLRKQNFRLNRLQLITITLTGISILFFEFIIDLGQAQYYKRMTNLVNSRTGCYILDPVETSQLQEHYFIPTWSLGFTSLLYNKSMEPKTVFTTEQYNQKGELIYNDFCLVRDGNRITVFDGWFNIDIYIDQQISFKKIFPLINY